MHTKTIRQQFVPDDNNGNGFHFVISPNFALSIFFAVRKEAGIKRRFYYGGCRSPSPANNSFTLGSERFHFFSRLQPRRTAGVLCHGCEIQPALTSGSFEELLRRIAGVDMRNGGLLFFGFAWRLTCQYPCG